MIRVTIETEHGKGVAELSDGVTLEDLFECCKNAAMASGFHPDSIKQYFDEEEQ